MGTLLQQEDTFEATFNPLQSTTIVNRKASVGKQNFVKILEKLIKLTDTHIQVFLFKNIKKIMYKYRLYFYLISIFIFQIKILSTLQSLTAKKVKTVDRGRPWKSDEGFQFIIMEQVKALIALGAPPNLKVHKLHCTK